jgi:translation initiation factor IF-3
VGSSPTFGTIFISKQRGNHDRLNTPQGGGPKGPRDLPLLNERIRDREVRLIDEDGTQLGIVPTREALATAKDKGLDLFLVQPDASPPVARIMDYGRHKFEQEKRNREAKKKQHVVDVKEVKMRYKIEDHDYQVNVKKGHKFLNEGELRGREVQHAKMAIELMNRYFNDMNDLAIFDREPKLEGKSVIMILSPNPNKARQQS